MSQYFAVLCLANVLTSKSLQFSFLFCFFNVQHTIYHLSFCVYVHWAPFTFIIVVNGITFLAAQCCGLNVYRTVVWLWQ